MTLFLQVVLVGGQDETSSWTDLPHLCDIARHAVQRFQSGEITNQNGSGCAAQVARSNAREFLVPAKVPEHQGYLHNLLSVRHGHTFPTDLNADCADVLVFEEVVDEAAHQAGLSDGEIPQQTHFLA